jgi:hypothetical protein
MISSWVESLRIPHSFHSHDLHPTEANPFTRDGPKGTWRKACRQGEVPPMEMLSCLCHCLGTSVASVGWPHCGSHEEILQIIGPVVTSCVSVFNTSYPCLGIRPIFLFQSANSFLNKNGNSLKTNFNYIL